MTSFLYTEEGTTLSWEKTEQCRSFTFFTFPKFALQHFFQEDSMVCSWTQDSEA